MKTNFERDLGEILDDEWVRSKFYSPMTSGDKDIRRVMTLRYQTTANTSIGGSGIGNSRVLNPPPGINRFADPPRGFGSDGHTEGSGVHYHEHLEKPMDIVHIRPGLPRYNPLASFWTSSFNADAMEAVEYGWVRKVASFVGDLLGFVITAPLMVVGGIYKTLRSLVLGPNANKYNFYYLSPAPLLFWKGLDDMMSSYATKIGFTGTARYSDTKIGASGTLPNETDGTDMEEIMSMMPGIFNKLDIVGGYRIDTITLGHRYNMLYNMRADYLKKKSQELLGVSLGSVKEYHEKMQEWETALLADPTQYMGSESVEGKLSAARKVLQAVNSEQSDEERYKAIMGASQWEYSKQERKANVDTNIAADGTATGVPGEDEQDIIVHQSAGRNQEYGVSEGGEAELTSFQKLYASVATGGLDFFSLAVDKVESGSISISNSVGPSSIESMFNGTVSAAKGTWFSASGGNVSDGAVGDMVGGVIGGAKAFINGLANGVTGGVQTALFGGKAFIDIPDTYQSSSMTMPTSSYSFTSQAISGHPLSKLKMMFPVLALLKAATPMSGGPRSFMSPFLVSMTHKGKNICNLGMITDVSIEWGGSAGWDTKDIPNEIKCTFTVTNLDKNFHIPINNDMTDIFNDDGQYENFMNIIGGVSPTDLDRSWSYNIKTNFARSVAKVDRFFSAPMLAATMGAGTRSVFEGPISALGGFIDWRE